MPAPSAVRDEWTMNKIHTDELFSHLKQFLSAKGIHLDEGSYSRTIEKGCQLLADTINLSQQAVDRARTEVEKQFEQVRQVIHEKTAPRQPPVQPSAQPQSRPASTEAIRARAKRASAAKPQPRTRKPHKAE